MSIVIMLLSVTIGSLAQIPLKKSALHKTAINPGFFINPYTLFGYALMIIASLLSFIAVRHLQLKTAAIIETIGYVYIMIIGYTVFKEKMSLQQVSACLLIICGILIFEV